jgi:hypothetical protein
MIFIDAGGAEKTPRREEPASESGRYKGGCENVFQVSQSKILYQAPANGRNQGLPL